ncbi:uncharacterized protein SPAPADRAFT_63853 [Spathaspora passalidarum NRRL Y-27907]|uniref:Uncharacterized protein n=1 Tax=Spathaspora passalidarum (strain NRRL Y-27907 / 11-Y1) TaxID=619300 RepID=G3AVS1_SPAPN|nr:uncharacterized protein SPAPADRAFT_63853 [Spathaspora passalidarum NRRL Y-27907]EGW30236.1 hypothetical protein SPAPADRAFT_63853 [Spathaspora passalidarum NRRL Y-27907]
MSAVNENENENSQLDGSISPVRDITGNFHSKSKTSIPFARIHTNVLENSPVVIQKADTVKRFPSTTFETRNTDSFSSTDDGDIFYEASPELIDVATLEPEIRYYPTLLEETNYPTINVSLEPHMVKPLAETCELNLESVVNPIDTPPDMFFPSHDNLDADSLVLLNIMKHELKEEEDIKHRVGWFKNWFKFDSQSCWSQFIARPEFIGQTCEDDKSDVYLDKVFEYLYDIY